MNNIEMKKQTINDWQRFLRHVDSNYNHNTNMPLANLLESILESKLVNRTEKVQQEISELIGILNEKCEVEGVHMAIRNENYPDNCQMIFFYSINFDKLEKEDILKMLALSDKCKQYDESLKYRKNTQNQPYEELFE